MKYHQGKYTPKHPEKYVGDVTKITYRSSWEKKAMLWFDDNPNILKWNSEEMIIPYLSPVDNKMHRYFPDFMVLVQTKDGTKKKIMVEVKPSVQCVPPTKKKQTKRMITEVSTYLINTSKWDAARKWCAANGMEFLIMDEFSLGIKKR